MTMPASDLSPMLEAARAGCRESLGRVFQACRHYALGIARREIPADLLVKGSASDLVQEAFLEAVHGFDHFHGDSEAQFKAWLRIVLRRRIAKLFRRYRITLKRRMRLELPNESTGSGDMRGREVPADIATPSALVMEAEQTQALRRVLDRLPEDYRRVIHLRYEEERSFEEIGILLQRSANAARLLWLRAVEQVKHQLKAIDEQ
jgi:RNA polymerase sigma-70 factor, ECF subfamily